MRSKNYGLRNIPPSIECVKATVVLASTAVILIGPNNVIVNIYVFVDYYRRHSTTHEKLSRKLLIIVQVSFVFVNLLSLSLLI